MDNPVPRTNKSTTDVDRGVGLRIAMIRKSQRLSQTALGNKIWVTFQQIQKYETGTNRIGASRIQGITEFLGVTISELYGEEAETDDDPSIPLEFLHHSGALELVKAFAQIDDPQLRRDILTLVRTAARLTGKPSSDPE